MPYINLIRHGEVARPNLFCAAPDMPLSEKGWQQLQNLFPAQPPPIAPLIISSSSLRCAQFAEQLSQQWPCDYHIETRFKEMDFGDWTNRTTAELWQTHPAQLQSLWQDPINFHAPNGEAMRSFILRVTTAWADWLQAILHQAILSTLIFTHAGVMRVILAHVLAIPYHATQRLQLSPAHAVRLQLQSNGECSLVGLGLNYLDSHSC